MSDSDETNEQVLEALLTDTGRLIALLRAGREQGIEDAECRAQAHAAIAQLDRNALSGEQAARLLRMRVELRGMADA